MATKLTAFATPTFLSDLQNSFNSLEALKLGPAGNNATDKQWAEFVHYLPQCSKLTKISFRGLAINILPLKRLQALGQALALCNIQIIDFPNENMGDNLDDEQWAEMMNIIVACKQLRILLVDQFTTFSSLSGNKPELLCAAVAQAANLQEFVLNNVQLNHHLSARECEELGPTFANYFKVQTVTILEGNLYPEILAAIIQIIMRCPRLDLQIIDETNNSSLAWVSMLFAYHHALTPSSVVFNPKKLNNLSMSQQQALTEALAFMLNQKLVLNFNFNSLDSEYWEMFGQAFKLCPNVLKFELDCSDYESIMDSDHFEVAMQACAQLPNLHSMRLILPENYEMEEEIFETIIKGLERMQHKKLKRVDFENLNLRSIGAQNTPKYLNLKNLFKNSKLATIGIDMGSIIVLNKDEFKQVCDFIATYTTTQRIIFKYTKPVHEEEIAALEAIKAASQEFNYYIKGWALSFSPDYKIYYETATAKTACFFSYLSTQKVDEQVWQPKVLEFLTTEDVCALEIVCGLKKTDLENTNNFIKNYFQRIFNKLELNELKDIKCFLELCNNNEILHSNIEQNISNAAINKFIDVMLTAEIRSYVTMKKAQNYFKTIFELKEGETHLRKFYFNGILKTILAQTITQKEILYGETLVAAKISSLKRLKLNS